MRNSTKILIAIALGILIAILGTKILTPSVVSRLVGDRANPILREDEKLLSGETSQVSVERISSALHRMNSYRLPEGKALALRRLQDPRPGVRAAVAESLAMHPLQGEVFEAEVKLVADPDEAVRIAALLALSHSADLKREPVFRQRFAVAGLSQKEKLVLHFALVGVSEGRERASHLQYLQGFIQQSEQRNEMDVPLFSTAIKLLIRLEPKDPASKALMKKLFLQPRLPMELLPPVYRFLVRAEPAFLARRYLQDLRHSSAFFRMTVLNSMLELCPPDRWIALREIMTDPRSDANLRNQAQRLGRILGAEGDARGVFRPLKNAADHCEAKGRRK